MKIGQVSLIAFIVLVAVVICFLLLMCCLYCPTLFGGGHRGQPQPEAGGYYPSNVQGTYDELFLGRDLEVLTLWAWCNGVQLRIIKTSFM